MLLLLRRTLAAFVLFLLTTTAGAAIVTGTVTDAATHQPLSGMVVAAYDAGAGSLRGSATTDATGLYALTLPAGSYRILAYDNAGVYATTFDGNTDSYETSTVRQLSASGTLQLPFALVRGGSITGTVEGSGGVRRSGVTIEAYNLSGTRRGFTTSDANGMYTIVLPPGDYKLVAFDNSPTVAHEFYRDARAFAEANVVHVTAAQATQSIAFTLPTAARVSGTAVGADNHALLPGITVYAYTSAGALVTSTITNANGAFQFSLPPGAYRFIAADTNRTYATAFYATGRSFEGAEIVTLFSGEVRSNVTMSLPRAALLSGRVETSVITTVSAYNLDGTLHTQTNVAPGGTYTLAVAAGDYKLVLTDATLHYASEFYRDATDFASATVLSVIAGEQRTGIDFTPAVGGHIAGIVRDATQNQPLAGITVAAYDANGVLVWSDITDNDGKYDLVLAPSSYRLIAFDPQLTYAPRYRGTATNYEESVPLQVSSNLTTTLNFSMLRGVKLRGTVVGSRGNALDFVEIFALDPAGNRVAGATTAGDGSFALAVPPGSYKVIAQDPFGRAARRYYPDADSFDNAIVLNVALNQNVPAMSFTLPAPSKHRAVRH